MMYLWLCLVVVGACTSLRGAVSCGGKCIGLGSIYFIVSSRNEGRDVQEIAAVLEELEDWEALAGWLDIRMATINNINKNCPSFGRAQCQWRELVKTYCHGNAAGDPYRTAADIANN